MGGYRCINEGSWEEGAGWGKADVRQLIVSECHKEETVAKAIEDDGDVDTGTRIKACGSGMNGGWERERESLRV